MTMFDPSQATFWPETELPLMSSRAASRAKTSALRESSAEWAKEPDPAFGLKSSGLLASYHPATSSWRTSQTCLVALEKSEGDGLAEFSETWPSAGMMRNGKTYRRRPWAEIQTANEYGLLPTVTKSDGGVLDKALNCSMTFLDRAQGPPRRQSKDGKLWSAGFARLWRVVFHEPAPPEAAETHMGFPTGWTDLQRVETQSSLKSPK